MATVREGDKRVLVVVDVQVGVMQHAWQSQRVVGNVARAVERARVRGVPVLWVQHGNSELPHGSAQWQWVDPLVPQAAEALIPKHFNSAFEHTALEDELRRLDASHIVLAGAESNWCIRATAYGALERGYDLTLLNDAHTCCPVALDDGTTVEAEGVVRELNLAMTWLSYPGRSTRTASAERVDFGVTA